MKKLLPRSLSNLKGFTLVELLVVVAIIAILATISVTVFSAAQGSARDGKRRSEIDSWAKSIESAKDYGLATPIYKYIPSNATDDFPRSVPYSDSQGKPYCIKTNITANAPANFSNGVGNKPTDACSTSTGYVDLTTSISALTTNNLGATVSDVKGWTICAKLERSSTPACASSLTPN